MTKFIALFSWSFILLSASGQEGPKTFKNLAIASVHPLATQAGVNAVRSGGNAVDAAIATALTLGVVDGHNSGIGGGCFILKTGMENGRRQPTEE